jgi:CRISPR-associated endonuclease/helicase Cas3
MKVEESYLEKVEPEHDFAYSTARKFQSDFLDWIHEGSEQFCLMKAPTGAGKTAAFTELCKESSKSLLIYPTNALLKQQAERFENHEKYDFNVKVVSSDTLDKKGDARVEELLGIANMSIYDIVVTNPDILQAIIQDQYIDPSGKAMRFFNYFQSVVYDEFHFYNDFESSGLLLQSKIISERRNNPKIAFCSATPNEEYMKAIKESISDDIKVIEAEYRKEGDKFREKVDVERYGDTITSEKEKALELIEEKLEDLDSASEPKIAVIFNSAYRSNQFYKYLCENDLESVTEIDNGYDTKSNVEIEYDKPVLITTSKSEVGLDFDIETMLMEKPSNASSFIQRFGRAGRKSRSKIYLFNFGQVEGWWNEEIEFPEFENKIYEKLDKYNSRTDRIQEFMGMRSSKAVIGRNQSDVSSEYSEMYPDFSNSPNYGKWKRFFQSLEDANQDEGTFFKSGGTRSRTEKLIEFVEECAEVLSTLRGRSLNEKIKYPRGKKEAITSYDLISVLQNYRIKEVKGDYIQVEPKEKEDGTNLRIAYPGYDGDYKNFDKSLQEVEKDLQKWIKKRVKRGKLEKNTEINQTLLLQFLSLAKITRSAIPNKLSYGNYKFKIKREGTSLELEEIE